MKIKFPPESFSLIALIILCILCMIMIWLTGCSSFNEKSPQILEDYPECVVMLNTGEIYKGDKDKSGTVSPVNSCLDAIKRRRCAIEAFNKFVTVNEKSYYVVDWSDKAGLERYNACMLR